MNTKYLKPINQLLQKISSMDLGLMDGNSLASSIGAKDGSITLSDHRQVIVIEKLTININYASGGGATVNVK